MMNVACLAGAILKLQGLLVEALEALPPDLDVPVSAQWLSQVATPLGIRVGKDCGCATSAQPLGIRVGRDCGCATSAQPLGITVGKSCGCAPRSLRKKR
jgi:hypothetical protein